MSADQEKAKHGKQTAEFGRELVIRLRTEGYGNWHVFYDHGNSNDDPDHVAATKGFFEEAVKNVNRLTDVDVLIACPNNVARVLLEIEERACSPKKILGDVLAVLLCNGFAVSRKSKKSKERQQVFTVDAQTTLFVAGMMPDSRDRLSKTKKVAPRLRELQGIPGGVSPEAVDLVFADKIENALDALRKKISEKLKTECHARTCEQEGCPRNSRR